MRAISRILPAAVLILAQIHACGVEAPALKEVIIVFKTHFDIGYTDLATNVVQRYRTTMIDQALEVADKNRGLPPEQQFVWTIPGWPMKEILADWPGQSQERKQKIMRALDEGRFVVHAWPFTTHTELLDPEDLVRGMSFSSRICRETGKPLPRDAKMTDVPSHSWILPTLLKHAGVDFLHLGCNPASSSPLVPLLFWWEGPDGSRLLTMYSAGDYGSRLVPPPNWPHRSWLALIMTGDNHGPPRPEEVSKLMAEARDKLPGVKVRVGRLSDFSDALLAEKPELPVVRGDMADTWIYGPMSDPQGAGIARNTRPAIATADLLGTELRAWGAPVPDSSDEIARAYEQSLLYGEHTWGGAFRWIYGRYNLKYGRAWQQDRDSGKFRRIESSWDEHSAYILKARNLITPLLDAELEGLAKAVAVSGLRVVVFNPLPWRRTGIVTMPMLPGLKRLSSQTTSTFSFIAADIPPGGYRTFELDQLQPNDQAPFDVTNNVLQNEWFKVTLDPERGTISSIIEKKSGREWVDPSAPQGFGQYLYERFDRTQVDAFVKAYVITDAEWGTNELGKPSLPPASQVPYRAASPEKFQVRYELSPISASALMSAPPSSELPHAITTRLTLYRGQPWLDLALTISNKPLDSWPEAGWICLPFRMDEPKFVLGRLGGLVDPAKDIVAGCNFHQFALNSGMTITDSTGGGVGLFPLDSPLVSLGEPGCWKYSKTFTPRKPRVFVNLFNNQWSTNFRLWNSGTWTSHVRLWAAESKHIETDLTGQSDEARFPLVAAFAEGPPGNLPRTQAGIGLSRTGMKVTAFGPNPDGEGLLLRLWEEAGQDGMFYVQLPGKLRPTSVQPVDLRGRAIGAAIPVTNGRFKTRIKAFAPVSYALQ